MPTLLELFKTKVLDSSGNTAEVDFDVKDYKKLNPISSSDPLLNQTGVRAVNLARKNFSERLSETLLETELSGTRVYRAASEGVLYGTELVRISRRTTKILTDMKTATINEGGQVAPLITGALGRTRLGGAVNNFFANNPNGIVGGLLDRAERAGTQLLNRIGINLPTVMIPTRISLNDKFRRGSEPDTMITLSEIKEDSNGNIAGRVLSRVIDGTPRQIVRNAINEGISAARLAIRTTLFGARKQGAQNLASNPALYFSYSSKDKYSDTVDEQIDNIKLRNDLSTLLDSKTQSLIDGSTPGNPRSKENLDGLVRIGYPVPVGVGSDAANLYSEEFGTYPESLQWWNEQTSERNDLSTELAAREARVSNDDYSDYEPLNNFPGSIEFPLFPNKNGRNKYFNDGKNNVSYTKANNSEIGELPIGGITPSSRLEASYPGNIELKMRAAASGTPALKKSQLPYDGFDTEFNKAIEKYASLALSQGTFLAPAVGGGTPKLITSDALGINPKSDGINLLKNGVVSENDFVLLKFDKTQFRATITGLTETFSPSWDSGKFIGNAFNYYTYSGIERSVSFNFKVFSLSCEEHNNVWNKIEALSKKVYPKGYANFGIKAPIIDFSLTDLYSSRKAFIESLSYTIDDNSPWHISDEKGKMTLPMIVDVQITIKFIEYPGSEGDLYDFNNENCAVVQRPSNEQILRKSGTTDTTTNRSNNDSNIEAIRENQNDISSIETIDFESEDDGGEVPLIPQTPVSLQPRAIAPIPQPTPTTPAISRQLPSGNSSQQTNVRTNVSNTSLEPSGINPIPQPQLGEPTINRQLPGLSKTTPTTTDLGEEIQNDNDMIPPSITNEDGGQSTSTNVELSTTQEEILTEENIYSGEDNSEMDESTNGSIRKLKAKKESGQNIPKGKKEEYRNRVKHSRRPSKFNQTISENRGFGWYSSRGYKPGRAQSLGAANRRGNFNQFLRTGKRSRRF